MSTDHLNTEIVLPSPKTEAPGRVGGVAGGAGPKCAHPKYAHSMVCQQVFCTGKRNGLADPDKNHVLAQIQHIPAVLKQPEQFSHSCHKFSPSLVLIYTLKIS